MNRTKLELKKLLGINLVMLLNNGPKLSKSGICYNIDSMLKEHKLDWQEQGYIQGLLIHYSASWPKFSGYTSFPIPSSSKNKSPADYYSSAKSLWTGNQAHYRRSLIKHIIACIDKELAE